MWQEWVDREEYEWGELQGWMDTCKEERECVLEGRGGGTEAERLRGNEAERSRGNEAERLRGTEAERLRVTEAERH